MSPLRWFWGWLAPEGYPPTWLRHVVSWRLLEWIDGRYPSVCWADLVQWKIDGAPIGWVRGSSCQTDYARNGACWCGKLGRREVSHG